ncbi:MAG: hypothetical protein WDA16_09515 [Candidatus Thermoplasmatota archaeon]
MPWTKDKRPGPGELEFHLASDPEANRHNDEWRAARAARLSKRHHNE